jgi:hypothetical protein
VLFVTSFLITKRLFTTITNAVTCTSGLSSIKRGLNVKFSKETVIVIKETVIVIKETVIVIKGTVIAIKETAFVIKKVIISNQNTVKLPLKTTQIRM